VNAKVIPIAEVAMQGPVCGGCAWWQRFDDAAGECFYNPPVARMLKNGTVDVCRPITLAEERGCAKFKGAH